MDCVCKPGDACVFHASGSSPKSHNVSEFRKRFGETSDPVLAVVVAAPRENPFFALIRRVRDLY